MYNQLSINLLNLLLSLSDALDLASPELSFHQMRTAFIVWELAKVAKMDPQETSRLFSAALLHDIGALSLEHKIEVHRGSVYDPQIHCILGERILSDVPFFADSAVIVRYHHTKWTNLADRSKEPLIFSSQILMLADILERSVDRKKFILHQDQELISKIVSLSGSSLNPEAVDLFKAVCYREDFWLDLTSSRLYSLLLHAGPGKNEYIDQEMLHPISILFRNIIDFRSKMTATHSSGVAAAAVQLSKYVGLTELELDLMGIAGNLHDLGKLVIPTSILDKADKLTKAEFAVIRQHTYFTYTVLTTIGGIMTVAEWAAFHHERLDGTGYPFHLKGDRLNLGSRIMAVADIFTALAEDRPYRKGLDRQGVLSILQDMGKRNGLDRMVLRALEENYDAIEEVTKAKQAQAKKFYDDAFSIPWMPDQRAS